MNNNIEFYCVLANGTFRSESCLFLDKYELVFMVLSIWNKNKKRYQKMEISGYKLLIKELPQICNCKIEVVGN